jgi:hypothetical protein
MKTLEGFIVTLLLLCGLVGIQSCSSKNEVTGSLTITVMDQAGTPIANEQVFLATSLDNLKNKVYKIAYYTTANGSLIFRQLPPQYYWYTTEHYKGFGADNVFATVDQFVILYVEPLSK